MEHVHLQQLCEAYALGVLDEDERRQLETHLQSGCDECTAKMAGLNRVITALGLPAEPVAPPTELKKKILQQALQAGSTAGTQISHLPFHFVRSHEGQWQTLAPGVTTKILFADTQHGRTTMLLRMSPGSQLFSHRHEGTEELFMIEGDCISQGVPLSAGDYHRAEGGSTHSVTSTENGCLMLVISPEIEMR